MFKRLSPKYKALLLALVAYVAFSISDAAVKLLTPYYSVYQIVGCDLGIAATLFLLFSSKFGGLEKLRDRQNIKLHILRGALNSIGGFLVVTSFSYLPLTSVYTVMFLSPFMMTLIAIPFYGERCGFHRWIAMLAGFSGVLIAFRPWENENSPMTLLILLGIPICFSIMHSVMRAMKSPSDMTIGFYPTAIACVPMLILAFTIEDFVPFAPLHLIPLFISAILILIGFITVSRAYHMAEASLVAPMQYTQLIWGVILGFILFKDLPDFWMSVGSAIVIISGIYLLRHESTKTDDALPSNPGAF